MVYGCFAKPTILRSTPIGCRATAEARKTPPAGPPRGPGDPEAGVPPAREIGGVLPYAVVVY